MQNRLVVINNAIKLKNGRFIKQVAPKAAIGPEMYTGVSTYVVVHKSNNSQPILCYEILIEAERSVMITRLIGTLGIR